MHHLPLQNFKVVGRSITRIWHAYIHFVCVGNESAVQFRARQGEHARIHVLWVAVYVLNRPEYILIVRYIVSSYNTCS